MGTTGPYSELEYIILAMIGQGLSSGYAMRKQLTRMRGCRWSGESGSVYRVLRRLEEDGLVVQTGRAGVPKRERTEFGLSVQGESVLHAWLTFPPERAEFGFLIDPVRTRCGFIGRLKPSEQVRAIKGWLQENKLLIVELERELKLSPEADRFAFAAQENLLMLAEARQEWLKRLLMSLKADAPLTHAVVQGDIPVKLERV